MPNACTHTGRERKLLWLVRHPHIYSLFLSVSVCACVLKCLLTGYQNQHSVRCARCSCSAAHQGDLLGQLVLWPQEGGAVLFPCNPPTAGGVSDTEWGSSKGDCERCRERLRWSHMPLGAVRHAGMSPECIRQRTMRYSKHLTSC